jgi:hypothetical protein
MKFNWFKTTYSFLVFMMSLLVVQYAAQVYAGGHAWKTGDWLINYSDGFIRRGLSGSLSLLFAQKLSIDLKWVTFALQASIFTLLTTLTLWEFWKFKETPKSMFLLLSPAFAFMFWINDPSVAFRKEICVYLSLIFILKAFKENNFNRVWYWLGFLTFLFSALSHEITLFFLPFFIFPIINYTKDKPSPFKTYGKYSAPFILSSLLVLTFSILYKGSNQSANLICSSLKPYELKLDICTGAIEWLKYDTRFGLEKVIELGTGVWLNYILLGVLSFLPLIFLRADARFNALLTSGTMFMFPLFVIAVDYGRFISMIYTSSLLTAIWTRPEIVKNGWRFTGLSGVAYCFLWALPNCCQNLPGKGLLGDGLFSIFSILFR